MYYVYILTNHTNVVLYVGMTNDLTRRLYEHKIHVDDKSFVSKYRLYKLVWFEEFNSSLEAIESEKKIKGWRREKKINLIKTVNPEYKDLNEN